MAAPVVASVGTLFATSSASPAFAVPSGVASGDIIVVYIFVNGGDNISGVPTGFALADVVQLPQAQLTGGTAHSLYVYWKRATGADTGTYVFTNTGSSLYIEGAAFRVTGCVASGSPWDSGDQGTLINGTTGTVSPSVSMTTSGADRLLVFCTTNWTGGAWTAPTGMTAITSGGANVITADTASQAVAGSTGSVTATCAGTSPTRTAWIGALIPPSAGTPITMSDSGTESESIAVVVNVAPTDSGTESESMAIKVNVSPSDSAALADSLAVAAGFGISDSATLSESMSVGVVTPIAMSDAATLSESMVISLAVPMSDSAAQSESMAIVVHVSPTDTATLSESMTAGPLVPSLIVPPIRSLVVDQTTSSPYPPALVTIGAPPQEVQDAVTAGIVKLHRRVEIYESDAITPFNIPNWNRRLNSGSITVDGTRDERRMIDVTLDNGDFALNMNPYGGFYYEKILKVFWGIEYYTRDDQTTTATVQVSMMPTDGTFESGVNGFTPTGGTFVASSTHVHSGTGAALLTAVGVNTQVLARTNQIPVIPNMACVVEGWVYGATSLANIHLTIDWFDASHTYISSSGPSTSTLPPGTFAFMKAGGVAPDNAVFASMGPTMTGNPPAGQAIWVDDLDWTTSKNVPTGVIPTGTLVYWETQIGEFMIDQIDEDRFPNLTHVTGRDYTKRCLVSPLTQSETFGSTFSIEQIITGLAANAGISKFRMPFTGLFLDADVVCDIGTARFAAMTEVADAVGYEVYFTADGYLTIRPYQDPLLSPLVYTYQPGPGVGTLVEYKKTSDDSQLKNHSLVIGATVTSDVGISTTAYGEAFNDDPMSPSRRFNADGSIHMGDRLDIFTSDYITAPADAQALANQRIRVLGLEEFSVDFSSIIIPWLDANDIIQVIDPNESVFTPTRFLFSNFTLPLGLGPMTGNAKRVTIAGTLTAIGAQ